MSRLNTQITLKNPVYIPMVETDYYLWLIAKAPTDIHSIETKKAYLVDRFDFVVGKSSLNPKNLSTLKNIESWYFDRVIKPTLGLAEAL